MTYYPNSIEIAQKLLSQQGEIIDLKARIDKARKILTEDCIANDCIGDVGPAIIAALEGKDG